MRYAIDERVGDMLFFRLDQKFVIDGPRGKLEPVQRFICWGDPRLISLLSHGPVHIFIDCTYHCVPAGFKQLLIVMIYSTGHKSYVPIFYVLIQSKLQEAYENALRACVQTSGFRLRAKTVTCDFEQGLINAAEIVFQSPIPGLPKVPVVGCLFHWKQALYKKLTKSLSIPPAVALQLVGSEGMINMLAGIPIEDVEKYGVPFLMNHFKELQVTYPKLEEFWKYFVKQWIDKCPQWNVHDLLVGQTFASAHNMDEVTIINRTNNPLERYNKEMKEMFPNAHPKMVDFVQAIREEASRYVIYLENVLRFKEKPNNHKSVTSPHIPDEYYAYVQVVKAEEAAKKEAEEAKKAADALKKSLAEAAAAAKKSLG